LYIIRICLCFLCTVPTISQLSKVVSCSDTNRLTALSRSKLRKGEINENCSKDEANLSYDNETTEPCMRVFYRQYADNWHATGKPSQPANIAVVVRESLQSIRSSGPPVSDGQALRVLDALPHLNPASSPAIGRDRHQRPGALQTSNRARPAAYRS